MPGSREISNRHELRLKDGFVIITAASDQGMVDIHDRKPLVLSTKNAREWIDPETSVLRAEEFARGLPFC
ncbi:hypothetical protein BK673_30260 [Pseudomonas fluorescens]|uniref:Abasic site processing protein n=2 Tax=Pseudomonas TaxID=286 RepID=A0A423GIL0_9PSED|nr:hypothetical protein BK658_28150 [Pseudomonas brassicacearum]RON95600.1 hypothetical protein BK673_30260 [Pseudomonas fluorescens]